MKLVLVAAAALINERDEILLAQRPEGKCMAGLWEFPGGKVEEGETPEQALIRELEEELAIRTNLYHLNPVTFASHSYPKSHLLMPLYTCRKWEGEISPQENQQVMWVALDDLHNHPMPPADLPIIPLLRTFLGG